MTHIIFTYGSLMFEEVWTRVVRSRYRSMPAVATDYARFAVRDETYPAMIASQGSKVAGVVYCDVDESDVEALDHFEGEDYRRCAIELTVGDGRALVAETYLYVNPTQLSQDAWIPENFDMQRFIASYCRNKLGE